MPGRPPQVAHLREGMLRSLSSAKKLVESVQKVGAIHPNTKGPRLHTEHVRRVIELAFLGIVSAWEEFLEQVFVRYLAGAKSDSGYSPTLRVGKAIDIGHAYHIVSADPEYDPAKLYLRFGEPGWTVSVAKIYFEGGRPFAPALTDNKDRLMDAMKLRNRVAHASTKCREDFRKVARSFFGLPANGGLSQGFGVGDLLMKPAERHFGDKARDKGWSIFYSYVRLYGRLAKTIVPKK